jgi:hypothetical protein
MRKIFEKLSLHRVHVSGGGGNDYVELEILHNQKIVQRIKMSYQEFGAIIGGEPEVEIKAEIY